MKIRSRVRTGRRSSLFIEIPLVFVLAFVSIYGTALFITMRTASEFMLDNFTKDPWQFISYALGVAAFIAVMYFRDRRSRVLIVGLDFDDVSETLKIESTAYFSDDILETSVPYQRLKYSVKKEGLFFWDIVLF